MAEQPVLSPPGGAREQSPGLGIRRSLWIGAGIGVLVLLGLYVILILPGLVEKVPATDPSPPRPNATAPISNGVMQKQQAQAQLAQVLQRRAILETEGIAVWGGAEYRQILDGLAAADEALDEGRFSTAIDAYQRVLDGLEQLQASKAERFAAAMTAGRTALDATDGTVAQNQFRTALALRPDDEEAKQGLARATSVEKVADLLRLGQAHESQERLDAAQEAYAAAVALDVLDETAQNGLERVSSRLEDRAFQAAMGDLLSALDKGKFARASKALGRARALKPEAPELREAADQLTTAKKDARLQALSQRATRAENREDWRAAAQVYRQALKQAPDAAFAHHGLRRADAQLDLWEKLDRYLSKPKRLQASQVRANAESVLEAALAVDTAGPKLKAKRDALQRLIATVQTPVTIRLRSDNATHVVIYHVRRLGRFEQRVMNLRPGTYTIVGSREGYRDVRKVFTVSANDTVMEIDIRCEERI